jgi:hypothetical protein
VVFVRACFYCASSGIGAGGHQQQQPILQHADHDKRRRGNRSNPSWQSGSPTFTGPSSWNCDMSVIKDTHLSESKMIQFRAEFFNIFNHPTFATPNGTLGNPSFGLSTSTQSPERQLSSLVCGLFFKTKKFRRGRMGPRYSLAREYRGLFAVVHGAARRRIMKSVEGRQAELLKSDLWLQQHPTQSKLIALAIGLLFFGICSYVLDFLPRCEPGAFLDGAPVPCGDAQSPLA